MREISRTSVVAVVLLTLNCIGFAAAPNLLNYQGRLTTPGGTPVVDNTYAVTFSIYGVPSAGSALWTETQAVTTVGGIFSAVLGSTIPFAEGMFSDSTRYLGIKVGADQEISPRSRLTSVPYALGADNGWRDGGSVILQNNTYDFVGIGTTNPIRPLHVNEPSGYLFVSRMESAHPDATVTEISNTSSNAVWEASVAGSNGIPFWGVQPGDMYFYKQGTPWPNAVLSSGGSLGLGTSLPRARIEAVTLDTIAGLFLSGGSASATKVLRAEITGSDPVDAIAVYGKSTPSPGYGYGGYFTGGWMGVRGISSDDGGFDHMGVSGEAGGNGATAKIGVRGLAIGTDGVKFGVHGTATGTGENNGVFGTATGASHTGRGVYGVSSTSGSYSYGGRFEATGPATLNTGVYAIATGGLGNYAGYFWGDTWVVGTVTKNAGSFRIDHPLDPENKYLQHSFVESPDMMNIYNGNVVTDASGNASITLPNWFEALNKDFRYQLTVIGQFAQAIVSAKIAGNQFSIKTDKPNVEVSWQVTGIRKDVYAEQNRIQVEIDKNERERGKYVSPESYGKGRESGVGYREELEKRAPSSVPAIDDEKLKIIEK